MSNALVFIVFMMMVISVAYAMGSDRETHRLRQKCLVEMEDKPHKEATTICNERVK